MNGNHVTPAMHGASAELEQHTHRQVPMGIQQTSNPNVLRVNGVRHPTFATAAGSTNDDAALATRWKFLQGLGITDLLAHWMVTNLTDDQFTSMTATLGGPPQGGPEAPDKSETTKDATAARLYRTASVTAACLRALSSMPHLRAKTKSAHGLTERELQKCKARGIDPAKYAATKTASMGGR